MTEVLDHAPETWTQSERLVAVAIAEQANDGTRRGSPDVRLIARRSGLDVESLSKTLRRLAKKGTELRVPTGTDRSGRVVFAYRGHRTDFQIPRLCPRGDHKTIVCMRWPDQGPAITSPDEPLQAAESPDQGPAIAEPRQQPPPAESPDGGPAITSQDEALHTPESPDRGPGKEAERPDRGPGNSTERPDHRPGKAPERPDHGPGKEAERPDGGPERPDHRPALPLSTLKELPPQKPKPPSTRVASTAADSTPPKASTAVDTTGGRRSALFPRPPGQLSEAVQVVLDALRAAGYDEATTADAAAVRRQVSDAYGAHRVTVNYLRTMAANGSFGQFYDRMRRERAQQVKTALDQLRRTEPPCEHGQPAGRAPHPTHNQPLCPLCRCQIPPAEDGPTTEPVVTAALHAYRDHFAGRLTTVDLVVFTQQATALHRAGADGTALVTLAADAGRAHLPLLAAATSTGGGT